MMYIVKRTGSVQASQVRTSLRNTESTTVSIISSRTGNKQVPVAISQCQSCRPRGLFPSSSFPSHLIDNQKKTSMTHYRSPPSTNIKGIHILK